MNYPKDGTRQEVRLPVGTARRRFSRILRQAACSGQRTIVCRHGYPLAVIIPYADLPRLHAADRAARAGATRRGGLDELPRLVGGW